MYYTLILFPSLVVFFLALIIALHHLYAHSRDPYDHAREESCAVCCYLQPSDMRNHEIWVISLVCIAVTWFVAGNFFMDQCAFVAL
jgi:hypothetical protein